MGLAVANAKAIPSRVRHKRFRSSGDSTERCDGSPIHRGHGEIPEVTQHYKKSFTIDTVYQSLEKPELAIAKWQGVLRSDPTNADALFGLGEAYEKMGECIKAVECYQRYMKVTLPEKYRAKLVQERIQHLCRVIRAVYSCNVGGCA